MVNKMARQGCIEGLIVLSFFFGRKNESENTFKTQVTPPIGLFMRLFSGSD